jgi:hypothetical protein
VFWYAEGVTCIDSLPLGVTIKAQHYSNLFRNDLRQAILKKRHHIDDEIKHGVLGVGLTTPHRKK